MDKLKIEYLSTDELIPYANNPRNNDDAVDYVANSIREFGFKNPVIVDKDNTVVCGHTRLKAAKKLGIKEVPCIRADDLTEEQIKAFRLSDNKVGELAEWNFNLLDEELNGIFDIDMSEFGFDIFSMDDIEEVEGYDKNNDDRKYFEKVFTFPIEKKQKITNYLKKHIQEITDEIIKKASEEA